MQAAALGHPGDRAWLAAQLAPLPAAMRRAVESDYRRTYGRDGRRVANLSILQTREQLGGGALRLAASDSEICDYAETRARACQRQKARVGPERAYAAISGAVRALGYIPPEPDGETMTEAGAVARMEDGRWWRRQLRTTQGRAVESAAIRLGLVQARRRTPYASDDTVNRRAGQKTRNRAMLEACLAINELGQEYTLSQLAELSVSNPVIRRGELMTRIAGFQWIAEGLEHVGEFYTLTCPSRMHRTHHTGKPNERYDGTTPREAQRYLCGVWAKVRAALHRRGIGVYGIRVAEPHHDGCPHWHLLLFMEEGHRDSVREIFRDRALQVDGTEPGAALRRFEAKSIDPAKGTAAGYVAKYVAKNIDGHRLEADTDLFGVDPKAAAARVDAWASTWGIRQFQQVGGPPVTTWRELRRLGTDWEAPAGVLAEAYTAADTGNWRHFVEVMGGPTAGRKARPVQLWRAWNDKPGRYGDPLGEQIAGVSAGAVVVPTRIHEWRIERGINRRKEADSNECEAGRGAAVGRDGVVPKMGSAGGLDCGQRKGAVGSDRRIPEGELSGGGLMVCGRQAVTWSPVNNCTPAPEWLAKTIAVMNSRDRPDPAGPWCCIEAAEQWRAVNGESHQSNPRRRAGAGGAAEAPAVNSGGGATVRVERESGPAAGGGEAAHCEHGNAHPPPGNGVGQTRGEAGR